MHLVRASPRYVSWKDARAVVADLKLIYRSVGQLWRRNGEQVARASRYFLTNLPLPPNDIHHPALRIGVRSCHNHIGGIHDKSDSHTNF